jgi:hypothetical protein
MYSCTYSKTARIIERGSLHPPGTPPRCARCALRACRLAVLAAPFGHAASLRSLRPSGMPPRCARCALRACRLAALAAPASRGLAALAAPASRGLAALAAPASRGLAVLAAPGAFHPPPPHGNKRRPPQIWAISAKKAWELARKTCSIFSVY